MHRHSTTAAIVLALALTFNPTVAGAQGCEPIRFTAPVSLGGQGEAYQRTHDWQLTMAYRYLKSDDFFIGTTNSTTAYTPHFKVHTVIANVAYAFSDRWTFSASLPVSRGTLRFRESSDNVIHEQRATGVGDLSVMGEGWVLEPREHARGNVALSIGLKAPTGSTTISSPETLASGATINVPVHNSIQPGDGGWALILQSRAFRQVTDRTHIYAFGSYMVSQKAKNDMEVEPNLFWAVSDVYSARIGSAYTLLPDRDLTVSLGGRVDGIPVHNVVGSGDDVTIKHPAIVMFAEPGLSMKVGTGTMTVNVPYRLGVNRMRSVLDVNNSSGPAGGGFAKYVVFAAYSHPL